MSKILTIDELIDVIDSLKEARFDKTKWKDLGRKLGLYPNTLAIIDSNKRGDIDSCFTECLEEWLKRADGVDKVGKPSLDTLAGALEKMNFKPQAECIRDASEGKKPAKRKELEPTSTKKSDAGYKRNDGGVQGSAAIEEIDGGTAQKDPPDWPYNDEIMRRVPKT
ncbi:PREDICTED: uncharacterized protein LOC109583998 [Amphimedon queenslandica]|uniref:Death domain-containing protein n=1 Tax=Amphimedon queenslandica TaxID=400682 RepID=A0AAN0JEB3_AMPQE|nr:PREDICTED: uncharacterized protein LOC109583998 [Amphimedon queenslandica]|eukprot:XP_019855111.1 PREDICTED: uncharacterized protein LOC109583998 [Amphimedon queenslandica]